MKNFAIKLAWFASLVIFMIAVLAQTTLLDQLFLMAIVMIPVGLMYMVYRLLKEDSRRTQNHWYENYNRSDARRENSTSL